METGWLSPAGDFYPCPVYDHIDISAKKTLCPWIPMQLSVGRRL